MEEELNNQIIQENDNLLHCICKQSYKEGEIMIQCDNLNCKISWFHPKCVGLEEDKLDVLGAWMCSDFCQQAIENQDRPFKQKNKKKIKFY